MNGAQVERLVRLYGELRGGPWPGLDDLDADTFADALWLAVLRRSADSLMPQPAPQPDPPILPHQPDQGSRNAGQSQQPPSDVFPLKLRAKQLTPEEVVARPTPIVATRAVAPRALDDALGIGRALRPLRRSVPSPVVAEVDEVATVAQIAELATVTSLAEAGIWYPVVRPSPERWLSLVVLVDQGATMAIWRDQIREFVQLIEHHGAFRTTALYGLRTDDTTPWLTPWLDLTGRHGSGRPPQSLLDPCGRRLILILSDCVAAPWAQPPAEQLLRVFAGHNQVALVQMLPERLWRRTALARRTSVLLRAQGILPRTADFAREPFGPTTALAKGVAVPVVPLQARALARLAGLLTGAPDAMPLGSVFSADDQFDPPARDASPATIEARVRAFESTASSGARVLARCLAVVPVILPVARLLAGHGGTAAIAEVFLSGLLEPASSPTTTDGEPIYTFQDGARAYLARTVTIGERCDLLFKVGEFMSHLLSLPTKPKDFDALVQLLQTAPSSSKFGQDFALLTARTLELLGGAEALRQARMLKAHVAAVVQGRTPPLDLLVSLLEDRLPEQAEARLPKPVEARLPELIEDNDTLLTRLLDDASPPPTNRPATALTQVQVAATEILQRLRDLVLPASPPSTWSLPPLTSGDFEDLVTPKSRRAKALAQFVAAAAASVQRHTDLKQRYSVCSTAFQAYGDPLPDLYEVVAADVDEYLDYAYTAIKSAEKELRDLHNQALQWSRGGTWQGVWSLVRGGSRREALSLVGTLLDDAARQLDQADAGLARMAALPVAVAAQVQALLRLVQQHRSVGDNLVRLSVSGPQLQAERDLAQEVQQIIESLPQALQINDHEPLPQLSPQWVADTRKVVTESNQRLNVSLGRFAQWHSQAKALDAQIADLQRMLHEDRQLRDRLSVQLRPEVLLAERTQIATRLETLSRQRRGITVAAFANLRQALDETLALAEQLLQQLGSLQQNLADVAAALPDLAQRLARLHTQIARAESGPFRINWQVMPTRIRELEQLLAASTQWPALKSAEQTLAEVKETQRLDAAMIVIERRLADIQQQRTSLAGQVNSPVMQRDEAWIEDVDTLEDRAKAYGLSNWPSHLDVRDLGRKARHAVNAKGLVPDPDYILPEDYFDDAVNNVAHSIAQFQEFDDRIAEVQQVLSELRRRSQAARDHADLARQLFEHALTVVPNDRAIQDLCGEAQRLLQWLTEPIKDRVADLVRKVDDLHKRGAATCLAAARHLWAFHTAQLTSVSEVLREILVMAPFWQDAQLAACQQTYDQLQAHYVTLEEGATLEQNVSAMVTLANLLTEGQQILGSARAFLGEVKSTWSVVAAAAQQVHDEIDAVQRTRTEWPPLQISLKQVESQIQQAEALASNMRSSATKGAFTAQASQTINDYQRCLRTLQVERQHAEEHRGLARQYEQKLTTWEESLAARIGQSDLPPALCNEVEVHLRTIRSRRQALRDGHVAQTHILTPTSAERLLGTLWHDAQQDIVVGNRPDLIALQTIEDYDGRMHFILVKRRF